MNEENVLKKEYWINVLNEQEFLFLFFQLAGYGNKYNFSTALTRDNAFRSHQIHWDLKSSAYQYGNEAEKFYIDINGNFKPNEQWM